MLKCYSSDGCANCLHRFCCLLLTLGTGDVWQFSKLSNFASIANDAVKGQWAGALFCNTEQFFIRKMWWVICIISNFALPDHADGQRVLLFA